MIDSARRRASPQSPVKAAVHSDGPPKYERPPRGSLVDEVEPRIRELVAAWPTSRPRWWPSGSSGCIRFGPCGTGSAICVRPTSRRIRRRGPATNPARSHHPMLSAAGYRKPPTVSGPWAVRSGHRSAIACRGLPSLRETQPGHPRDASSVHPTKGTAHGLGSVDGSVRPPRNLARGWPNANTPRCPHSFGTPPSVVPFTRGGSLRFAELPPLPCGSGQRGATRRRVGAATSRRPRHMSWSAVRKLPRRGRLGAARCYSAGALARILSGLNPWSIPHSTARVRLSRPSFRYADLMCAFTVLWLM